MSEAAPFEAENSVPNAIPSTSQTHGQGSSQNWQELAQEWLSSLPDAGDAPPADEFDAWINSNASLFPDELRSLPRSELQARILAVRGAAAAASPRWVSDPAHPYRFQRSDQWKPVYMWLESLDAERLVDSRDIASWLDSNPKVTESLLVRHSRYHLIRYIQRLHLKVLKKKGTMHKGVQLSAAKASLKFANSGVVTKAIPIRCKLPGNASRITQTPSNKNSDALLRYELLTDLRNQLTIVLSKNNTTKNLLPSSVSRQLPGDSIDKPFDVNISANALSNDPLKFVNAVNTSVTEAEIPQSPQHVLSRQSRTMNLDARLPAWACSEAILGTFRMDKSSSSHVEDASSGMEPSLPRSFSRKNIFICLEGREKGLGWPLACSRNGYAGRNHEKWIPFLQGWRSLEKQFHGPAVLCKQRDYSSWSPTWCAYASSVAVTLPNERRHWVQKVLDVRFHPEGLPQLVCGCNEGPNELLLYNLYSGRSIQLSGHNCLIQAVEFAVRGASVVSCGANLLKVWDCITGSCLYTLGSVGHNRPSVGHAKKISAMTVNAWQSCLVATSGSNGDGKLLLWNALRGELASDLNISSRDKDSLLPSIDAMEFCSENVLVCGSDCLYGGPAVVQIWDVECPRSCSSFSAHDAFISALKINPSCNTIITGAGDGSIGLFDIRTGQEITYLSVGSNYEITSVSFSSCGTYFSASSTSNNTLVWDTRLTPMSRRAMSPVKSNVDKQFNRPLHCLSHGKQMPTAEHSGPLPGHVDEGHQGVNDARWLHREPVLVTVSGDGSIAMWDVTLGQPCVRHVVSHNRCVNTVAVSPDDEYLCSGGDDQKLVLYQNSKGTAGLKWRLSHPLAVETL